MRQVELFKQCRTWITAAALGALVAAGSLEAATAGGAGPSQGNPNGHEDVSAVAALFAYSRPDNYQIHITRDLLVPMRDGFVLTCDLYQPALQDGSLAPGRFPGIVLNFTGYGRTFYAFGNDLRSFTAKGYNTIWCNTRGSQGFGGSSPAPNSIGLLSPWQPQEQRDDYDLIEWFAAQPWSTGKIGQIGTSYGGISTFMVAGRQMPPSLKAIIPIAGVTDMYRQFVYPGGIRTVGDARGMWAQGCSLFTGDPTCSVRIPAQWAAHPTYDSFWQEQTIDPSDIKAATLYVEGLQDFFLDSVDVFSPVLNARNDFALLLGPWVHSLPEINPSNPLGTSFYLAWFDRWLRGDQVPHFPKVIAYEMPEASTNSNQYRAFSAWPPIEAKPQRIYLKANGDLALAAGLGSGGSDSYTVGGDGSSGELTYTTEPFKDARVVSGPVDVTLTATFSAPDGNIIVDLHDVGPDGATRRMGPAGYLKASHRLSDSSPTPVVPGQAYELEVRIPSKFWKIEEGHRLMLKVTSADAIVASDAPAGTVTISTAYPKSTSYLDLQLTKPAR